MSVALLKTVPDKKNPKKSISFLGPGQSHAAKAKPKVKSCKKSTNNTEVSRKTAGHNKSSLNKTTLSIGDVCKSSVKSKKCRTSRDYLILDSTIYQCENIEEVNEKMIFGNSSVYNQEKFYKATTRKLSHLKDYLQGFNHFIRYQKKTRVNTHAISVTQKTKLYALLKSNASSDSQRTNKINPIDELVKFVVEKVEKDASCLLSKRPNLQENIQEWRNEKLHQLLSAHTLLEGSEGL